MASSRGKRLVNLALTNLNSEKLETKDNSYNIQSITTTELKQMPVIQLVAETPPNDIMEMVSNVTTDAGLEIHNEQEVQIAHEILFQETATPAIFNCNNYTNVGPEIHGEQEVQIAQEILFEESSGTVSKFNIDAELEINEEDEDQLTQEILTEHNDLEADLERAIFLDENYVPLQTLPTDEDINKGEEHVVENLPNSNSINKNLKENNSENSAEDENDTLTKTGHPRKRKCRSKLSFIEKEELKIKKLKEFHSVHPPCSNCKYKCTEKITDERRNELNRQFWNLNWMSRRMFILHNTKKEPVKRRTAGDSSKRNYTFKYFLKEADGTDYQVCKHFFLTSLGFTKNNDTVLHNVLSEDVSNISPKCDNRGKHPSVRKIDREIIKSHVETFNPCVSHYRREHAPHKRYLPSDITIKHMHSDFISKHKNTSCSYYLYRSVVVDEMKISFANLGNEECESCESFSLHNPQHKSDNMVDDCSHCQLWKNHINMAKEARENYRADKEKNIDANDVFFCADLQKVIMLPRMEMFKKVIFTKRIIAFNESFVPLGSSQRHLKPIAIIWHEGIAGRKKEDILSAFHAFFVNQRDAQNITLWLDNCSGQNKNWTLLTYLVYVINSNHISAKTITLKYFEPGHTFMAADAFHHQVELSLKKQRKTYDFPDFQDAVQNCNSKNVIVKSMTLSDYKVWKDCTSSSMLKKLEPRPYLNKIVEIRASRGIHTLQYKTSFANDFIEMDFLFKKNKTSIPEPQPVENERGIPVDKKDTIISQLSTIIPATRLEFWKNIKVADVPDLVSTFE